MSNKAIEEASEVNSARAAARIDWGHGRIIGFSIPKDNGTAFDVIRLLLNGYCLNSTVASQSVFELARDLSGIRLPPRENSAFELRIPQGRLLPSFLTEQLITLELINSRDEIIFSHELQGANEVLRLTEGTPADLVFDVRFRDLSCGSVHGDVKDKLRTGIRPTLFARINENPQEPLPIYDQTDDGSTYLFAIPLRSDRLRDGLNHIHIVSEPGQPMATFPIHIGNQVIGEADRRIASLEAEVAFLKHLVLNQNNEALPARLAFMKSEIIAICSDMLSLQRTNLERESTAAKAVSLPASSSRVAGR